jgi:hypothetical protein
VPVTVARGRSRACGRRQGAVVGEDDPCGRSPGSWTACIRAVKTGDLAVVSAASKTEVRQMAGR